MQINVDSSNLRSAATQHDAAAQYLRTVPDTHADIQASLDSLGPIFAGLREAGRELLEQRKACYYQQADDHADMCTHLDTAATTWEQSEAERARRVQAVCKDPK